MKLTVAERSRKVWDILIYKSKAYILTTFKNKRTIRKNSIKTNKGFTTQKTILTILMT